MYSFIQEDFHNYWENIDDLYAVKPDALIDFQNERFTSCQHYTNKTTFQ